MRFVFLVVSLLFMPTTHSFQDKPIDQLMALGGAKKQFDEFPIHINRSFKELSKGTKKFEKLSILTVGEVLRDEIRAANLEEKYKKFLSDKLSPEHIVALVSWFKTPLSQKVLKLEMEERKRGLKGVERYMDRLKDENLVDPERVHLISSIVKDNGFLDLVIITQKQLYLGAAIGINNSAPLAERKATFEVEREVDEKMPDFIKQTIPFVMAQTFRAYENLTKPELRKYLKFVQSPEGKAAIRSFIIVLENGLKDIQPALPKKIETEIKKAMVNKL